jgi:hypothetical protein
MNPLSSCAPSPPAAFSIAPAAEPFSVSKPALTSPHNFSFSLIEEIDALHREATVFAKTGSEELRLKNEELQRTLNENLQVLQDNLKRQASTSLLDRIRTFAEYLLDTLASWTGLQMLAAGVHPVLGATMITLGVLNITSKILKDLNGWDFIVEKITEDREKQKQLFKLLPGAIGLFAAFVNVAGLGAFVLHNRSNATLLALTLSQVLQAIVKSVETVNLATLIRAKSQETVLADKSYLITESTERYTVAMASILSSIQTIKKRSGEIVQSLSNLLNIAPKF